MRIRVYVSQKDIDNGHTGNAYFCPLALAIKRKGLDNHPTIGISDACVAAKWYKHSPKKKQRSLFAILMVLTILV